MSKKKYTFTMVVVKPTGKGGKPLKPKEIKPKKKRTGGMSNKPKDPKVVQLMPKGIFYKGKAKDYPGVKELIKRKNKSTGGSIEKVPGGYSKEGLGRISDKGLKGRSPQQVFSEKEKRMENTKAQGMTKKMDGGMIKKYNKGGQMLKGGQKKLDKNKDGKISGEDFKLIRREKPEMKPIKRSMGSTSTEGNIKHGKLKSQKELKKITDSDEYKKSDYQTKNKMLNVATQSKGGEMKKGYGAARQSGMGLQDENLVPGKSMDYYKDLM